MNKEKHENAFSFAKKFKKDLRYAKICSELRCDMKTLVKINKKENINSYISLCDGFIVGLEDFSIDYDDTFNIEEIESRTKHKKYIFVAINKNIFKTEI